MKRTFLMTGCSSGIGRSIGRHLLDQKHKIIGLSRDTQQFNKQHSRFIPIQQDLTDIHSLEACMKQIIKSYPDIDGAIFAAGFGQFAKLEQFSYPQINQMMQVNFTSQACISRSLLPHLKKKPLSHLIYIGSEAGLKGSRQGAIYCASKFALRGFCQAIREESSGQGIRVSLINPGMVDTEFYNNLDFHPGKQPEHSLKSTDIAATVNYILSADPHVVIDEVNINPVHKVIDFKNKKAHSTSDHSSETRDN